MRVIFPPRPKTRIVPGSLARFERRGTYVAQRKFNGTRNTIHVSTAGEVSFWHWGGKHKQYKPTPQIKDEVRQLQLEAGLEYWLDSELLYAKTKDSRYKGKMVLFDILTSGKYLFGVDQMTRLELLAKVCGRPTELEPGHGLALCVTPNIWMAETFERDFVARYQDHITCNEIEGLVLRRKDSVLDNVGERKYEVDWQIRCRKPNKLYNF